MEVKPAEFARMAGVSRASISEKIKKKTLIINGASMLDTENPVNAAYLTKHRRKQDNASAAEYITSNNKKSFPGETFTGSGPPGARPDDFALMQVAGLPAREMLNMTMREIIIKYPGIEKIERYSKILKDITMSAEKEQRIQERELTTISKDFVISRLFSFVETIVKQIVDEYPEAAADRIIALAITESETTRIDVITTMKHGLGQIVAGAKENIINELNSLRSKYQNENQNNSIEELKEIIQEARNE